MSYDPACRDLARYFLGDLARGELVGELAQHIQTTIEDWLEFTADDIRKKLEAPKQ